MKQWFRTLIKPFTKNMSRAVITAFSMILVMMIVIGALSVIGMDRLNNINELSEASYKSLAEMKTIEESIVRTESGIREHFSGNNWKSYVDGGMGASAYFDLDNQQLNAQILDVGNQFPWSIQLIQGSFALNKNHEYLLTFKAVSTKNRPIQLLFQNSVDYTKHYMENIDLTNEMKTYTVNFRMNHENDVLTHVVFLLGNIPEQQIDEAHKVMIDQVSLLEVATGKQLLHNGEFVSKDVQLILEESEAEMLKAVNSFREYSVDRPYQKKAIDQMDVLLHQWLQEKRQMIKGLNLKLATSGNLNADSELQSYESTNATRLKITSLIHQIKEMEELRLNGKRKEASSLKQFVQRMLVGVVTISVLLCILIYLYFKKAIITPIGLMSESLRISAGNSLPKKEAEIMAHEKVHLGISEISQLYEHMTHYSSLMSNQIQIDGLTGLTNRTTFDEVIKDCVESQEPFYLVLMDIDHFKKINDTYGHLVGDEVIKRLGNHLLALSNKNNLCFRYGGEEFGMLMRGSDLTVDAVYAIAEKLRISFANTPNVASETITISVGISRHQEGDDSPVPVIQRADSALYHSKVKGRNCTTIWNSEHLLRNA